MTTIKNKDSVGSYVFGSGGAGGGTLLSVAFTPECFQVSPNVFARWTARYPAVDVALEVAHAHEWILSNPRHAKRNWERFLVNWLKRSQDRASRPQRGDGMTMQQRATYYLENLRKAGFP